MSRHYGPYTEQGSESIGQINQTSWTYFYVNHYCVATSMWFVLLAVVM